MRAAGAQGLAEAAPSLAHLRNGRDGTLIFDFAVAVGDYRTAWRLLDQMQGPLARQVAPAELARMAQYRGARAALRAGDYGRAWDEFGDAFRHHAIDGQDNTILLLLRAMQQIGRDDPRAAMIRDALSGWPRPHEAPMIPYNRPHLTGNELRSIAEAVKNLHLSSNGAFTRACQAWLENHLGATQGEGPFGQEPGGHQR